MTAIIVAALVILVAVVLYIDTRLGCPCDVASPCAGCPLMLPCQAKESARDA